MTAIRTLVLTLLFTGLAALLTGCITPTSDPARLPSGEWRLDPRHASVSWRVRHLGTGWTTGRFDTMDAVLTFDPARPQAARLTATIETASISTGQSSFDAVLRQPAWLAADSNPQILYRSERIEITSDTNGRAFGALTLRGVTLPAIMDVAFHGGVMNPLEGRRIIAFSGEMVIDRDAFGIGDLPHAIVGESVHIRIEAEFLRQGDLS